MTRPWAGRIASVGDFLYRRIGRPPIRRCTDVIVVHGGTCEAPDCPTPGVEWQDGLWVCPQHHDGSQADG